MKIKKYTFYNDDVNSHLQIVPLRMCCSSLFFFGLFDCFSSSFHFWIRMSFLFTLRRIRSTWIGFGLIFQLINRELISSKAFPIKTIITSNGLHWKWLTEIMWSIWKWNSNIVTHASIQTHLPNTTSLLWLYAINLFPFAICEVIWIYDHHHLEFTQ